MDGEVSGARFDDCVTDGGKTAVDIRKALAVGLRALVISRGIGVDIITDDDDVGDRFSEGDEIVRASINGK